MKIDDSDNRVGGNSDPLFLRGEFDLIDFLVELINLDWVSEIRVLPYLDLSVLSSGDEVLTVLVDV